MRRRITEVALLGALLLTGVPPLQADAEPQCSRYSNDCSVDADKPPTPPRDSDKKPTGKPKHQSNPDRHLTPLEAAIRLVTWQHEQLLHQRCLSEAQLDMRSVASCGAAPRQPAPITTEPVPQMTPGQAGAIAAARLQLPMTAPGIGPSPNLNEWKMAAVGYPLWLWLDGTTHVGSVRDSVGGLSVSLDARVTDLSFQMGDRHVVHCIGTGRRWSGSVANKKSPVCGYAYQKPSLPKGSYTVTAVATWSVRWTVNGQSGVITMPIAGSTQLPVGELQVLVR